jgi:glycosyltransferase involved in cell wall biosynthesis
MIIVDNDSGDNSEQAVRQAFPGVKWIGLPYNAGFARANNEGIRAAEGNAILLLNADTLIEGRAIEKCYSALISSSYMAAGIQLLNADRSPQISGLYDVKGGMNYLLPLPYLGNLVRSLGSWFRIGKPHAGDSGSLTEVDWINGAFLMAKREAIEKAGLMDEDFFLYAEEAEWCSRLRQTGPLCIFGFISSVHLEGETVNSVTGSSSKKDHNLSDRKGLQIMLSNFVRIRKQYGGSWFLLILFFYILEIPVYFAGLLLGKLIGKEDPGDNFQYFRGYCRNVAIIIKHSGIILRNEPHFYKVL